MCFIDHVVIHALFGFVPFRRRALEHAEHARGNVDRAALELFQVLLLNGLQSKSGSIVDDASDD